MAYNISLEYIFSYLIFNTSLTFAGVWLGGGAWFIHCIAIYYILYYFARKLDLIKTTIIFSFTLSIIYFFTCLPITKASIYQGNWHYVCFFSIMMLGFYCAIHREKNKIYTNKEKHYNINNFLHSFLCNTSYW